MSDEPTKLADVLRFPFLAERVKYLSDRVLYAPDDTVLWVGAGVSAKFGQFPTWGRFLSTMLDEFVDPQSPDYAIIRSLLDSGRYSYAAEYIDEVSRGALRARIGTSFQPIRTPLPVHLSSLCVREIVTTNYDRIIEEAMPWYEATTPATSIEKLMAPRFRVVKIHGSVEDPENCVLSLSSYVRAYTVNLRWYLLSIFQHCSVVFLGTSLSQFEPFFETLRLVNDSGKHRPRHIAIKSVADEHEAKREGKRLQALNIDLIPYVPDAEHTFIDEILAHVGNQRGQPSVIQNKADIVRSHLASGRREMATVHVWHLCNTTIAPSVRKIAGDAVSAFFRDALFDNAGVGLHSWCKSRGLEVGAIWDRWADFVEPKTKSLHGLREGLNRLEFIEGRPMDLRRRKLEELTARGPSIRRPH